MQKRTGGTIPGLCKSHELDERCVILTPNNVIDDYPDTHHQNINFVKDFNVSQNKLLNNKPKLKFVLCYKPSIIHQEE